MSILGKLRESTTVKSIDDIKDYSGSSYISESGIYDFEIKKAFLVEAASGAVGVYVEFGGEVNYDETFWVSNREGQTFFVKNGKEVSNPSYVQVKKLNYLFTNEFVDSLTKLSIEERIVKHFEWVEDPENDDKKKKVDKEITAEVLVDWIGKTGKMSVQMAEKEAQTKQGDKYVGTGKRAEDKDGNPYLEVKVLNFFSEENKTASEQLAEKEAIQMTKDSERIAKTPVRVFKPKGAKKAITASGGTSSAPKKPNIF